MEIDELAKAGLTGCPLTFAVVGIAVCFVSLFIGWPWEGIIVKNYICKCKNGCSCQDEE
jgi:hypothetical protein